MCGVLIWALILQFLPRLYELGRSPSAGVMVQHILDDTAKAITSELTEEIQVEHKSCSSLKHYTCSIYSKHLLHLMETLQCVIEIKSCHWLLCPERCVWLWCVGQEQAQAMLQSAQSACPRVVQRTSVSEQLANRVANKTRQAAHFVQSTVQQAESSIKEKLR